MMEGLDDGEVNQYFDENPKIISLLEIDIFDINTPYISHGEKDVDSSDTEEPLDDKTLRELRLEQEAMEKEMQASQCVQAFALEELNLDDNDTEQRMVPIAKEMQSAEKTKLTELLRQHKYVFAWSVNVMKELDLTFCQH